MDCVNLEIETEEGVLESRKSCSCWRNMRMIPYYFLLNVKCSCIGQVSSHLWVPVVCLGSSPSSVLSEWVNRNYGRLVKKSSDWSISHQQVVWLVNVESPLTSFSLSKEVTKNESHQNRLSYHNEPCPCQSTFLFARLSTFCAGTTSVVWMICAADSILFICWLCVPEIIIYSIYWIILHIWALFACRIDIQNILNIQNLPPTNSWWYIPIQRI